jgi:hypothetical protein
MYKGLKDKQHSCWSILYGICHSQQPNHHPPLPNHQEKLHCRCYMPPNPYRPPRKLKKILAPRTKKVSRNAQLTVTGSTLRSNRVICRWLGGGDPAMGMVMRRSAGGEDDDDGAVEITTSRTPRGSTCP